MLAQQLGRQPLNGVPLLDEMSCLGNDETEHGDGLEDWLRTAGICFGLAFSQFTGHATVEPGRLSAETVWLILRKRADLAGITATTLDPIAPHGLRAGFVTQSYLAGARDEEIMQHTRHRHLATMRRYVRRAKLSKGGGHRTARPVGFKDSGLRQTRRGPRSWLYHCSLCPFSYWLNGRAE